MTPWQYAPCPLSLQELSNLLSLWGLPWWSGGTKALSSQCREQECNPWAGDCIS